MLYGRGLDRIFFRRGHFVLAFSYSFGMDTGVAWVAVARVVMSGGLWKKTGGR